MVGGGQGGRGGAAAGGGGTGRAEADRWLVTSEKLLASNDLPGAKTFAIRACEADPTRAQAADYILAICDVLIAGENRLGDSNLPDWYAVLRLGRLAQNPEHVATQYRRLALLLNPSVNKLPFADRAFKLVSDAWHVLSDPSRKSFYDQELQPSQPGQLGQSSVQPQIQSPKQQQQQSQFKPPSKCTTNVAQAAPSPSVTSTSVYPPPFQNQVKTPTDPMATSFWTACPYCFVLFEYAKAYEECTLKCQNCRRAFQAVTIQKPPVEGKGEDVYFCSWAVFPLGFSGEVKTPPRWSPISPLFACPIQKVDNEATTTKKRKEHAPPRIYYDDDDIYVAISEEDCEEEDDDDDDDDDWQQVSKKANVGKGKETVVRSSNKKHGNDDEYDWQDGVEVSKKASVWKGKETVARSSNKKHGNEKGRKGIPNVENITFASNPTFSDAKVVGSSSGVTSTKPASYATRKRMGTGGGKNLGRLDLNVEFSNEVEEPPTRNEGNGVGSNREVDNIEGIGFFEGLDEFLSSLPILSVVGEDKIKAT